MKLVLVILGVLVGLQAGVAVVEVVSSIIEHSSVPGVPDRIRYTRHIQYGRWEAMGSSPRSFAGAERRKRDVDEESEAVTDLEGSGFAARSPAQYVAIQAVLSLDRTTTGTAASSAGRRRRNQMPQLPTNVIHALPPARAPVFDGRTRRNPTVGRIMRPNRG